MKKKNRKYVVTPLLLLLLLVTVGGTVAWLTAKSSVKNSFTVGSFNLPTTDPTDPTKVKEQTQFLDEPSWVSNDPHKLLPGVTYDKDPYVGIGKGSEDAVVYVYVKNAFTKNGANSVYFTINDGWEAVSNTVSGAGGTGSYVSGLFKYTAGLTNAANADVWTTKPLFSEIVVSNNAKSTDFEIAEGFDEGAITVESFIHQAKDGEGKAISDTEVILPAAKTAFGIN